MSILVAYASRYGATEGIAERIAGRLRQDGQRVDLRPVIAAGEELAGYDAFVVGSAVYFGSWLKPAAAFVRRNATVLTARPLWLFSSGPLGTSPTDAKGQDLREVSRPKEYAEFEAALHPREHRILFGALDRRRLHFADRLITGLPAFPGVEGDFRDWAEIDAWADAIAREVAVTPAGAG